MPDVVVEYSMPLLVFHVTNLIFTLQKKKKKLNFEKHDLIDTRTIFFFILFTFDLLNWLKKCEIS